MISGLRGKIGQNDFHTQRTDVSQPAGHLSSPQDVPMIDNMPFHPPSALAEAHPSLLTSGLQFPTVPKLGESHGLQALLMYFQLF